MFFHFSISIYNLFVLFYYYLKILPYLLFKFLYKYIKKIIENIVMDLKII